MSEFLLTLLLAIFMLLAVCFIGSLILAKNTKDFQIKFGLKGFEVSGSFYRNQKE